MAVVTSDYLAGVLTNFRALFAESFEAARNLSPWREIAMEIPSTTLTETHTWLGTTPTMKDVSKGDLILEGLPRFDFSIENKVWKAGIEVERAVFEDDKVGLLLPRLRQLGEEAARHPGQLILNLPVTNPNAFDAVAFFADTRMIGLSANVDNILAGTGTTVAQFQTDLGSARAQMRKFQDDQGRPMNLVGNIIMVPAELEQVAYQALNANQGSITQPAIPATEDGAIRSAGYVVIVNPFLTDVNDWYLLHAAGSIRPFIYQTRVAPALEGVTNPTTESGVIRDRFIYSVRARYEVGVGDPRHAVKTTNT